MMQARAQQNVSRRPQGRQSCLVLGRIKAWCYPFTGYNRSCVPWQNMYQRLPLLDLASVCTLCKYG